MSNRNVNPKGARQNNGKPTLQHSCFVRTERRNSGYRNSPSPLRAPAEKVPQTSGSWTAGRGAGKARSEHHSGRFGGRGRKADEPMSQTLSKSTHT
ncbi:Hypothetical predicted protein [Podarcis lilfordi]|uniref:Uncharacterized protein n=1 Tax=Podarcis lilfordi TaxID=74358 RepID=A0AA35PU50_9SAUR|nr:Hypothetical predicted protein [Podarcis lilfordi]